MLSRRILPLAALAMLLVAGSSGGAAASDPSDAPGESPPANVSPPTISGTPLVGETLTGTRGEWTGPSETYAYQWERCDLTGTCTAIDGEAGTTYVLAAGDLGATMRFAVVATNKNGSTTVVSDPTAVVQVPVTTSTSTTTTTTTTTTATTTTTTTPSGGNLFWSSDFESGALSAFGGVHTGLPIWGNSSATVVQQGSAVNGLNNDGPWIAPAPHNGTHAVALLVDGPASATGSAGSQRAELTSGYFDVPNTERWYGLSVYIPSVPNRDANGGEIAYNNALWETGWGSSLNLKMSQANDSTGDSNSFQIASTAATAAQKNGWSAAWYHISPIVYDQWVNFTIHVYWATDSTGYFEVYENGKLMTLTGLSDPSFRGTRVNGPNYGIASQMVSEFDFYRGALDQPSLLYFDDLKIGDTYDVVQP